jgi:hypothetical protein
LASSRSSAAANIEQIAKRQKCSVRQVNMTISLAFLAPDLVKAAVEGRLPRGIGVERIRDAPGKLVARAHRQCERSEKRLLSAWSDLDRQRVITKVVAGIGFEPMTFRL